MSGSLNSVQLIGNLGKSPEIKTMNSGDKVANFSMAMSESWTKDGERKEKTEWVNVVVWGNGLVGVIEKYVKKGSKIYIQGALRTRKYEKDGSDRYATEVVVQGIGGKMLLLGDAGGSDGENRGRQTGSDSGYDQPTGGGGGGFSADLDDEIPFATNRSIW